MTDQAVPAVDASNTGSELAVDTNTTKPIEQPLSYKIPINGKEVDVSLEELKRSYGLNKASYAKMEEAAKIRKEAEQLKAQLSKKDVASLRAAGWSDDELEARAAEFIIQRAQEKSMTPEQRAQFERDREYKELKEREDNRVKEEAEKTRKALEDSQIKLYQTAFFSDVAKANKDSWLDLNDPVILANIVQDISLAAEKYNYDMSVKEAVTRLEEKMGKRGPVKKEYLRALLKSSKIELDDIDLDAFLEKGFKGVREKSVEAVKKAETPFAKLKSQTQSSSSNQSQQTEPPKDWAQYWRDVRNGKIKPY